VPSLPYREPQKYWVPPLGGISRHLTALIQASMKFTQHITSTASDTKLLLCPFITSVHELCGHYYYYYYYYYRYSALGPVWAETRAQSGAWYDSGTQHPGQILRGSLPLLSPYVDIPYYYSPTLCISCKRLTEICNEFCYSLLHNL
jgi:hypothetical protein